MMLSVNWRAAAASKKGEKHFKRVPSSLPQQGLLGNRETDRMTCYL